MSALRREIRRLRGWSAKLHRSPRRGVSCLGLLVITLLAWSGPAAAAITANLEWPAADFPASGIGNVAGWAFTDTPGAKIKRLIQVQIDSEAPFEVPCCAGRGDVEAAYAKAPKNTGFSGVYNFQRLSPGMHTLKLTIESSASEKKTIARTFEVVKVSPYKFLKSFRWKQGSDCESLNGLDPANGNGGAVCTSSRSTSKSSGNPSFDCDGTIQFAFNRAAQTFQPVAGCDPEGTIGDDDGPEIVDPKDPEIILVPGLPAVCFPNAVSDSSVTLEGLTPTVHFKTKFPAKVGVKIWPSGRGAKELAAFGVGPWGTIHAVKPFPLASAIEPDRAYVYEITVKSSCGKPDLVVQGLSSFVTPKRVLRAYIDKAHVLSDGDGNFKGAGEVRLGFVLYHESFGDRPWKEAYSGEKSVNNGDWLVSPASIDWTAAAKDFEIEVVAGEHDGPGFGLCNTKLACDGPVVSKTLSFGPSLTVAGGTFETTLLLKKDNLAVKVWVRVEITYE